MRPIPYVDINKTLKDTVNSLEIVKELKQPVNGIIQFSVVSYESEPTNNNNFIGIGLLNDKVKSKLDTYDYEEREYVFQVNVIFKRLGEFQFEIIEKLSSLFVILLKRAFRTSDEMICYIYERDENGDIVYDENNDPIVLEEIDLREIITITDITPVIGHPQDDGVIMYLKFNERRR